MVMDPESLHISAPLRKLISQLGNRSEETKYKTLYNYDAQGNNFEKLLAKWIIQFYRYMSEADGFSLI